MEWVVSFRLRSLYLLAGSDRLILGLRASLSVELFSALLEERCFVCSTNHDRCQDSPVSELCGLMKGFACSAASGILPAVQFV